MQFDNTFNVLLINNFFFNCYKKQNKSFNFVDRERKTNARDKKFAFDAKFVTTKIMQRNNAFNEK